MRATRVRLRDFRSYERAEAELGEGLTVVLGPNGAGKTNLLEAVYFALTSRSCRTSNERELVRLGADLMRTEAEVLHDDGTHLLEVGFKPGEPKRLRIDGAPVERFGPEAPRPLTVVFLPERLELVRGGPSLRRAHLDQFAAALHPALSDLRSRYARALAQRNALGARPLAPPPTRPRARRARGAAPPPLGRAGDARPVGRRARAPGLGADAGTWQGG